MILLGSERYVTQDYQAHVTAEDYSGEHLSPVRFAGSAKVIGVVNGYKPHEDSVNYQTFLKNQQAWKTDGGYNCQTLTGKVVFFKEDEVGGNHIEMETYVNGARYLIGIYHLASVSVSVGDIITRDTLLGAQGNTGLVYSGKAESDPTYGTHVHLQVQDSNGNFINPRAFATGEVEANYLLGANERDESVDQIKLLVDNIRIRRDANTESAILGKSQAGEIYTVYGTKEDEQYIWYEVHTTSGINGYLAGSKTEAWVEFLPKKKEEEDLPKETPSTGEEKDTSYELLYTCSKDGTYYLKLYAGEKLYLKRP